MNGCYVIELSWHTAAMLLAIFAIFATVVGATIHYWARG